MGYDAGCTMGRRVWAIVRALSVRGCKASPFSLSVSPCVLSLSLSLSLSPRLEPASGFHYFIIFKHVTFLARLSLSLFLSIFISVSLSISLGVAERRWKKTCWKSHNRSVQPLLGIINVDRWTSLPRRRVNSHRPLARRGRREKLERIFFHEHLSSRGVRARQSMQLTFVSSLNLSKEETRRGNAPARRRRALFTHQRIMDTLLILLCIHRVLRVRLESIE